MRELLADASRTIEELAERVHLSRNACWRRVKALEAAAASDIPEIIAVYRATGADYMMQAVVPDIAGYDRL